MPWYLSYRSSQISKAFALHTGDAIVCRPQAAAKKIMYIPKYFEITDKQEILAFIEANSFGQIISSVDNRTFATHLPFLISADNRQLIGHLAKQNPQWKSISGQEVLITFQGPHDYISPSWYSSPSVPTWNYQAVHVYGKCRIFDSADRLKQVVDSLAAKYEAGFEQPWQPEYRASMLQAIVGMEIEITDIQCKYKLNQNRPIQDQLEVARQLKTRGSAMLSEAMLKASGKAANG